MFILNIIRRYACCRIFNYHSPDLTTQSIPKNIIQQPLNLSYLDSIKYNDTVPFIPAISLCKVIKVYDGDTITIAAKLPYKQSSLYRFQVRLLGIDSPEMKGHTEEERARFGNNGRTYFEREFSMEILINKLEKIFTSKSE